MQMGSRRRSPVGRRHGAGHKVDALDRDETVVELASPGASPSTVRVASTPWEQQQVLEAQLVGTDEEYYGWTGARIWESSIILAHLADRRGCDFWDGRSVVELGCGCGLAGIAVAALGAEVTLTDIVTEQARANVFETFGAVGDEGAPSVKTLRWGGQAHRPRLTPPHPTPSIGTPPLSYMFIWF